MKLFEENTERLSELYLKLTEILNISVKSGKIEQENEVQKGKYSLKRFQHKYIQNTFKYMFQIKFQNSLKF